MAEWEGGDGYYEDQPSRFNRASEIRNRPESLESKIVPGAYCVRCKKYLDGDVISACPDNSSKNGMECMSCKYAYVQVLFSMQIISEGMKQINLMKVMEEKLNKKTEEKEKESAELSHSRFANIIE